MIEGRPRRLAVLPGGVHWRAPWPEEARWFGNNRHVAGFLAEDGSVVLSPIALLRPRQARAVLVNEAARALLLRRPGLCRAFFLTRWQRARFASYGTPPQRRHTIVARLVTGDRSAGRPTPAQRCAARAVRSALRLEAYEASGRAVSHALSARAYLAPCRHRPPTA